MKLVIFDLDQTLVDLIPVHDEATSRMFRRLFGIDARLTEIDFAGRSLDDNFEELSRKKSVPPEEFNQSRPALVAEYERAFGEVVPFDSSKSILPGVIPLLEKLTTPDFVLALYTGDSPGVVATVFGTTNLGRYFRFTAYGTQATSRADMVRKLVADVEGATGWRASGKDIVIVGDSIRDIQCGREIGARTIAVTTGFHSREQLLKECPDFLFLNLSDTERVHEAICGK